MPNNENKNNNQQLDLLLKLLAKNKKAPPKNASKEELSNFILNNLDSSQNSMLQNMMNNPKAANDLLNSPQAQEIIKKIQGKN